MRIVILHQAISDQDTIEDRDVLVQVETVSEVLRKMGHKVFALPCTLNLESMLTQLRAMQPELVFNLVESLGGADSLVYLTHAVLDSAGIRYTGNRTEAHFLTANKLLAKKAIHFAGLPTPPWIEEGVALETPPEEETLPAADEAVVAKAISSVKMNLFPYPKAGEGLGKWIVKGLWDQASRDLHDDSIVEGDIESIHQALESRIRLTGRPSYAEKFIEGREFNISMITSPAGVEVLPPAEIDFSAYPPEKPRIVGHRAKWAEDSFEYQNTPRTFEFPEADAPLLDELKSMSRKCWELFHLCGWARVDFRVDADGKPWILEVNTNPCLSPDAGFAAALAQAGIPFEKAIRRIAVEV